MSATPSFLAETEADLRRLAAQLTDPRDGECLVCYVYRMMDHGCTGLRWARRYRDLRAPRATGLERRLGALGGYCDCEILFNSFHLAPEYWVPAKEETDEDGITTITDPEYPDPLPPCHRVRRGSTQACGLWLRRGRYNRW